MCTRGVFQLQKLSLFFCDFGGSSAGIRELISSPKISQFLASNPHLQIQMICKRNHHPYVRGTYINGYVKDVPLRSFSQKQAFQALVALRNQLGRKAFEVSGPRVHRTKKSIQGLWQPNLFNKYPVAELTPLYTIPEVPNEMKIVEVPTRQVREKDLGNSQLGVREFRDPHRQY